MARKLALVILTLAITAVTVLVLRQQRLVAVYEMTSAAERTAQTDHLLWELRGEIASQTTPEAIIELAAEFEAEIGPLVPLVPIDTGNDAPLASAQTGEDGPNG